MISVKELNDLIEVYRQELHIYQRVNEVASNFLNADDFSAESFSQYLKERMLIEKPLMQLEDKIIAQKEKWIEDKKELSDEIHEKGELQILLKEIQAVISRNIELDSKISDQTEFRGINIKKEIPDYSKNQFYSQKKNFYFTGGYYIELDRRGDKLLEPGFLIKYVKGAPVQSDINILFTMVDKFSTGLSYRTGDAVMILLKLDINKNIKIQYSYDYTLSKISSYSSGNHEFSLSYGIELLPPPAKKIIHPRYYF